MDNVLEKFYFEAKENVVTTYAKDLLNIIEKNKEETIYTEIVAFAKNSVANMFSLPEWAFVAVLLIVIMSVFDILKESFGTHAIYNALKYFIKTVLVAHLLLSIHGTLEQTSVYIKEMDGFLGIIAPILGTLLATGGNVALAKTFGLFTSVFLSALQILLYAAVPYIMALFFGIALMDVISGSGRMMILSQSLKNIGYAIFSIFTALYVILLGTQSLTSSGTDGFSARAVRLLVGNAVPIVGGALGEALKLVGGGFVTVKNTVGNTAVLFLVFTYLPPLIILWFNGILLNVFLFLCDYFSLTDTKSIFLHIKYAFNFVLAAYTSIFMIGIINIGIFMGSAPAILS